MKTHIVNIVHLRWVLNAKLNLYDQDFLNIVVVSIKAEHQIGQH